MIEIIRFFQYKLSLEKKRKRSQDKTRTYETFIIVAFFAILYLYNISYDNHEK